MNVKARSTSIRREQPYAYEYQAHVLNGRREDVARRIFTEAGKPLFDARREVSRAIFNLANAGAEHLVINYN